MTTYKRIWELDALRGIAIILMVIFHTIFNLEVFFNINKFNHMNGFWFYEGRISAVLFILLVGIATSIIQHRYSLNESLKKNTYRGLRLITLGLIITAVTYVLIPTNTIWFGIMHFLGISILISIPLAKYKKINLILATILLVAHYQVGKIYTTSYLGIIFGIYPASFQSYDHYALIPWLGYVLLGIAIGNWLYPTGLPIIKRDPNTAEKSLITVGRYSLWIYFIHQPILLGLTWLIIS